MRQTPSMLTFIYGFLFHASLTHNLSFVKGAKSCHNDITHLYARFTGIVSIYSVGIGTLRPYDADDIFLGKFRFFYYGLLTKKMPDYFSLTNLIAVHQVPRKYIVYGKAFRLHQLPCAYLTTSAPLGSSAYHLTLLFSTSTPYSLMLLPLLLIPTTIAYPLKESAAYHSSSISLYNISCL